jgi:hypothetical protein
VMIVSTLSAVRDDDMVVMDKIKFETEVPAAWAAGCLANSVMPTQAVK